MSGIQLNLAQLDRPWLDSALPLVLSRFRGQTFTSDDLRELLPPPSSNAWWGVLSAKISRVAREVGRKKSRRTPANGRKVTVWELEP